MIVDKFKKRNTKHATLLPPKNGDIPVGNWVKCDKCDEIIHKEVLHTNYHVCPYCDNHFRLSSRKRLFQIIDEGTFEEFKLDVPISNPLNLEDYEKKLDGLRKKTGLEEAVLCGKGKVNSIETIICIMDGNFLIGSMGKVVGEKITYSIEQALVLSLPIVIFCVSGGARMQEGIISLMQMAKTSGSLAKLNSAGLLYISVLTDPTYGGVTASFASLGDIILAEPGAMIGFAGPRVIKQTISQDLPIKFQTAEFLEEHGFVDKIVHRTKMKDTLFKILSLHERGGSIG